ncbi:hypothetical protein AAHE18_08G219400 [Arachis hypogaea]
MTMACGFKWLGLGMACLCNFLEQFTTVCLIMQNSDSLEV